MSEDNACIQNARPAWPHKNISEADFRKIVNAGVIKRIEGKWEFTGEDTSREWLEATSSNGKTIVLPRAWEEVMVFVGKSSSPGLFRFNYFGEKCLETIKIIDTWEKKNASDRAEYERLKAKFAGA